MSIRTSHDFIVPPDTIINLFYSGCFVIIHNIILLVTFNKMIKYSKFYLIKYISIIGKNDNFISNNI